MWAFLVPWVFDSSICALEFGPKKSRLLTSPVSTNSQLDRTCWTEGKPGGRFRGSGTRASAISLGWAYQNQVMWCSQGPGHLQTSKKEGRRSPSVFMAPQLGWGMRDVATGARLWEASHMNQKQRLGHIFRRDFREHCSGRGRPCQHR